jgi:hypothetical protein
MITIRTSTEITSDRQIVLNLPPETPLGKADLVLTVAPASDPQTAGILRQRFGKVHGGDTRSADNERIDADLARNYDNSGE